jgi:hypothetical protein
MLSLGEIKMPGKAENKASERGMAKHEDRGQAGKGSIKSEEKVGSSDGAGIRFPVHDFHGMESVKTPGG